MRVRRSILFDAKADYLLYGMAEQSVVALARALAAGQSPTAIRGLCHAAQKPPADALLLPSFQDVSADPQAFITMFRTFADHNDALSAQPLAQQQDSRHLVHNPPQPLLTTAELDAIHELPFELDLHPSHRREGEVRALNTIRFALTTHRGCYGECNFCAIAMHQGRTIQQRSIESLVREATRLTGHSAFKGVIADVGGPTANMYGYECAKKQVKGACRDKRCLFPTVCPSLKPDHGPLIGLLRRLRAIGSIKKIVVASGLRHDLILADRANGLAYLREIIRHHVSGQLKIAPEHSSAAVLAAMGKPDVEALRRFHRLFNRLTREEEVEQYLTYYLMAAHPGCTQADMEGLRTFCLRELHLLPRQVQLFTPTPCTWSTLMYWTAVNPFTGSACFVEKSEAGRERQKAVITGGTKQRSPRRSGTNAVSSRKRPS
jgi:uncharacterized radical SAM protein YgiQ